MTARFEAFVARRYLRAKRKEAVISVVTVISVLGVAAGVMALIVALAINNGFRNELQKNLLAATAHVDILEKETSGPGIANWRELLPRFRALKHVVGASPALYSVVFLSGPALAHGAVLKGIDVSSELETTDMLKAPEARLAHSLERHGRISRHHPGIGFGEANRHDAG